MYERILVPTDGSECAAAAADRALELAATYGATVYALYVADVRMSPVTEHTDEAALADLLGDDDPAAAVADRGAERGVTVEAATRAGHPAETIVEYAEAVGADLVVMGTHGRTGLQRALLGSVAGRVVRTSPVPVLVVPPDDGD